MARAADDSVPLYERKAIKNTIARITELSILFLLFSLLGYRLSSLKNHGFIWLVAFCCELWFTFIWILIMNCKWSPVHHETYPERLLQRATELPHLDMFVTTADDVLEPPILTINTVLSLLAVDYPGNKLACYVSDDAASPLTFYCLVETSKFAKLWVPFCKRYNVALRAPFRYFNGDIPRNSSTEFQEEWKKMKEQYAVLCRKIEDASRKPIPCDDLAGDFDAFENIDRRNHPPIIKVVWENMENLPNGLPHLIYISREKRPNHPHHFKAGAMNVLYFKRGIAGLQGPVYGGTGCFHRRKIIYGALPEVKSANGNLNYEDLEKKFGKSIELTKSVAEILSESNIAMGTYSLSIAIDEGSLVASCGYEYGSCWGKKVGLIYGSATEDVLTGLSIHAKGWQSIWCTPNPSCFLGLAPTSGPDSLLQQKRWSTGLLEILFSFKSPIILTLNAKLQLRQCLVYLWMLSWGMRSIFEVCYAVLPAFCILSNSSFLPKVI